MVLGAVLSPGTDVQQRLDLYILDRGTWYYWRLVSRGGTVKPSALRVLLWSGLGEDSAFPGSLGGLTARVWQSEVSMGKQQQQQTGLLPRVRIGVAEGVSEQSKKAYSPVPG